MRRLLAVLAILILCPPALAETYESPALGFAADFPAAPTVNPPEASEHDADGKTISHSVMVIYSEQGVQMAAVQVDTFDVPFKIDVEGSLSVERDNFLKALGATLVTANPGQVDGNPATYFTYQAPGTGAKGSGVVAIVVDETPRIYMALTMYTPQATPGQIGTLDAFFKSFRIKH